MAKKRDLFKLPAGPAEICFDKNEFMKKTFSVDEFLQEHRNAATLETMRDDLGLYLKVLRSAMIELINEDYADFVNLSSNLVGLDQSIQGIQTPLNTLKDEIVSVRTTLEDTMQEVNECLEQKRQLREHLKSVQSLTSARASMSKLQKLLVEKLNDDSNLNPMLLERAAMELVKLKYNLQFCQQHLSRLEQPNGLDKFDEVRDKLLAKVETHFLKVLDDKKIDQLERCLRVYCTLGEYRAAEEIFRKKVVGQHMHPIISEVSLQNAPQGLNGIYNQIIQFLNDRMRQLLLLTQPNDSAVATVQGFDFIINSFWVEVEHRIETHMASIFAPGNPDSFYQKYEHTIAFLEKIEGVIKSRKQIDRFREHEQYKQFQSKWNLPVYFQVNFFRFLRFPLVSYYFFFALCFRFVFKRLAVPWSQRVVSQSTKTLLLRPTQKAALVWNHLSRVMHASKNAGQPACTCRNCSRDSLNLRCKFYLVWVNGQKKQLQRRTYRRI